MVSFLPVGLIVGRPPSVAGIHSTSSTSTPVTLPFLPMNLFEFRHQRRVHPSSWLELVFRTTGHCGHGVAGLCPTGGLGIISICVTSRAPCLCDVPIQSLPVSPPPITSTCFPRAVIFSFSGISCPARTLFC